MAVKNIKYLKIPKVGKYCNIPSVNRISISSLEKEVEVLSKNARFSKKMHLVAS
jgi:hypothetical protein